MGVMMETKNKSKKLKSKQLEFDFEQVGFYQNNIRPSANLIDFNLAKRKFKSEASRENMRPAEVKQIIENLIFRYK